MYLSLPCMISAPNIRGVSCSLPRSSTPVIPLLPCTALASGAVRHSLKSSIDGFMRVKVVSSLACQTLRLHLQSKHICGKTEEKKKVAIKRSPKEWSQLSNIFKEWSNGKRKDEKWWIMEAKGYTLLSSGMAPKEHRWHIGERKIKLARRQGWSMHSATAHCKHHLICNIAARTKSRTIKYVTANLIFLVWTANLLKSEENLWFIFSWSI